MMLVGALNRPQAKMPLVLRHVKVLAHSSRSVTVRHLAGQTFFMSDYEGFYHYLPVNDAAMRWGALSELSDVA
jgi:hypothetical protein